MSNPQAFPSKTRESWQQAALRKPQQQQNNINPPVVVREEIDHPGMTLRDYFAAKAMNNMLVSWVQSGEIHPDEYPLIARHSYEMANAMLAAREA